MSYPPKTTDSPDLKKLFDTSDMHNRNDKSTEEMDDSVIPLESTNDMEAFDLDLPEEVLEESYNSPSKKGYLQIFRQLQDRDSTFVFLFGKQQAGKTVLISSLIHHMGVDDDGALETRRRHDNLEGAAYLKSLHRSVREGYFMDRTTVGVLYELDLKYTPQKPKKPMNLTFLEMSGEDLSKVELSKQSFGKLPDNIDVFMSCPDIDLVFLLVAPYDEAAEQDAMMIDFLDYLIEKKPQYPLNDVLLVITKWDRYDGLYKEDVESFVSEKMPLTYSRIKAANASIARFSIGKVSEMNDHIVKLNDERPNALKRWLYATITGKKIKSNTSIFDRIVGLF